MPDVPELRLLVDPTGTVHLPPLGDPDVSYTRCEEIDVMIWTSIQLLSPAIG